MCFFNMRKYTCSHSGVGNRIGDCDFRSVQNEDCRQFILTPETIIDSDLCGSCKEDKISEDRLSVGKNSKPLPPLIGEIFVPGEGPGWLYEDGRIDKKLLDGEPVNAQGRFTKAFKRLAIACEACRKRRIKCDPAEPKCVQCTTAERDCRKSPTSGPRNPSNESLKLTKEVWKHEQARFLQSGQPLNAEDSRPPVPSYPDISACPKASKATDQYAQPVSGPAHNLSSSPQSRKPLPERIPQDAEHSKFTEGLLSVTPFLPLQTYNATPLRTLLAKYYILDAISHANLETVNSCLDVIHAEPPIRPLAESVAWLYARPPRDWLAIRSMIRNLHTDVLHDILDIISDAKLYSDYVLFHTPLMPILGSREQNFACSALFDCIRVRKYVLNMLFREMQAFILKLSRPRLEGSGESHSNARSSSDRKSPARSVPVEHGRTQAARDSMRLLHISSQRLWDRVLHPIVQASFTAMVYGRLYESLQYTLCRSTWPPILAESVASGPSTLASRTGPFPGLWTCKTGVILWKQRPKGPMLRVFPLHHDRRAPVQELTKCYWHFTFGSYASASNHRKLLLKFIQKHDKFLQFYESENSVIHDGMSSLICSKSFVNHVAEGKREQISPLSTVRSPIINLIHTFLEQIVETLRTWGYTEPPLAEGKARVRWRCKCGRRLFDDFDEQRPGAAKTFETWLNGSFKQRPVIDNSQPSMNGTTQDIPGIAQNIPENRTFINNDYPPEQRSQAYDPRPQYASHTVVRGCDTESRWLLVCAKGKKRPTTLSQLDICATSSDKELFTDIKKAYMGLRGKWTHILSLKKVQSIRFVQFELHIRDLVDIRKVPDMPPETKKDEYLYQPYDLIPPVGENLMAHLFHHPEDANERSITCLRAPKKRKIKLTVCPRQGTSVGWGIHLVEGWVVSRLWLLGLMLFIMGSLVFGVCWTVFRHDLQGAFSVAAYIITLMGIVVGALQAGLG